MRLGRAGNQGLWFCRLVLLAAGLVGALSACNRPERVAAAPVSVPAPAASDANPAASAPAAAAAEIPVAAAASSPAEALPAEIQAFRDKRDNCDHLRGEEPYDAKRAAFLKAELARTCKGTDKALAGLRKRFAHDAKALAALKDYEERIE